MQFYEILGFHSIKSFTVGIVVRVAPAIRRWSIFYRSGGSVYD